MDPFLKKFPPVGFDASSCRKHHARIGAIFDCTHQFAMHSYNRSLVRTSLWTAGILLALAAGPLGAQAPGTPESYVREGREAYAAQSYSIAASSFRQAAMLRPDNAQYQFLLAAALMADRRTDEAREFFAKALQLDPTLQPQVDAWLANAPAAPAAPAMPAPPRASAQPVPQPVPAAPAPARPAPERAPDGIWQPGDAVEVEYRTGFWIPGIVTAADPGACPYYRVRADAYGKGNPSNLGYFCRSVRAPTGVAAPRAECGGSNPNCPPVAPPPLGTYNCKEPIWQGTGANPQFLDQNRGPLELMAGGRYRLYEGGATGRYRYNPTTYRIDWSGGDIAGRGGVGSYGLDVTSPEITIVFGAGNSASRWQCGLSR